MSSGGQLERITTQSQTGRKFLITAAAGSTGKRAIDTLIQHSFQHPINALTGVALHPTEMGVSLSGLVLGLTIARSVTP